MAKRNRAKKRTIYSDLIADIDEDIFDEIQVNQDVNEYLEVHNHCSTLCPFYKESVSTSEFACQTPRSISDDTPRILKLKDDLKDEKQKVR